MEVTPAQALTLMAAAEVLISTTPVRYVTMLEATPLNANLSTPATTMIRTQGVLRVAADDLFSGVITSHGD